jgi:1,4-alpha-glucan branching enzyme
MKILLGVPEYPPYHVGGGGEVYKNLAENYRNLGHEVVVIFGYYPTKSWEEKTEQYTDDPGIKFYRIPEIPYPKSMPFLRTVMPPNMKVWLSLRKIIKKEDPDVAHLHGYGLVLINILAGILKKLRIRYIFTIHGYPEIQNKSNWMVRSAWKGYVFFIMNKTMKFAESITCVSQSIKEDGRNIFPNKSTVIYNGINRDDFSHVRRDIDIKKKHNIAPTAKTILSIGRIAEMKGFQDIIKIIPRFLERGIDVKYLIAGEDNGYKKELENLIRRMNIQDKVEFVGFLDLETKKQYLAQCDVFAIPSLWEPFGLVALEGMVYNKIIITSGVDGLKEVLENYENKILIDDGKIVEKILTYEPKPFKTDILEKFDYKIIARSYLKLINHLTQL